MSYWRIGFMIFLLVAAVPVVGRGADPTDALFARARFFAARSELNRIHIRLEREFVQSSAWTAAQANVIAAAGKLQSVRRPLIEATRHSPAYQRLWQRKYILEKQLEAAHAKAPSAGREDEIYGLANRLLELRQSLTQMEADALAAEPTVEQVKQELVSSNQQLRELWDQHAQSIPADSSWRKARRRMEIAHAQWIDAAGRWQGVNDRDWESNHQRLVSIGNLDGGR